MMSEKKLDGSQRTAQRNLAKIWQDKHKKLGLTLEKAGEICGWSKQMSNHYLKGRSPLNITALSKFSSCLEVTPIEIFPDYIKYFGISAFEYASLEEETLVKLFRNLSPDNQAAAIRMMRGLSDESVVVEQSRTRAAKT